MNSGFYIEDSDEFYFGEFWDENRKALRKQNAVLLPRHEANKLKVCDLLRKSDGDDKPVLNKSYDFFAIPYELDDDVRFERGKLIDYVINFANNNLGSEKFFASTDHDKCCVVKFSVFNEAILWAVASGHLNTPFVLFDGKKKLFLLLDYDFPIQLVGHQEGFLPDGEVGRWKSFFRREWPLVLKRYSNYTNLDHIMAKYYPFIELPDGRKPA